MFEASRALWVLVVSSYVVILVIVALLYAYDNDLLPLHLT